MKNVILILAGMILVFFEGCGSSKIVSQQDYDLGKEKSVTVGSVMLSYSSIEKNKFSLNSLDKGIKEELVYTGKSGNTIKIDYREYYVQDGDWYMADGYPLHLEYDLSSSDLITCKYYKIKVLSSDNNEIKFIVINDQD